MTECSGLNTQQKIFSFPLTDDTEECLEFRPLYADIGLSQNSTRFCFIQSSAMRAGVASCRNQYHHCMMTLLLPPSLPNINLPTISAGCSTANRFGFKQHGVKPEFRQMQADEIPVNPPPMMQTSVSMSPCKRYVCREHDMTYPSSWLHHESGRGSQFS